MINQRKRVEIPSFHAIIFFLTTENSSFNQKNQFEIFKDFWDYFIYLLTMRSLIGFKFKKKLTFSIFSYLCAYIHYDFINDRLRKSRRYFEGKKISIELKSATTNHFDLNLKFRFVIKKRIRSEKFVK